MLKRIFGIALLLILTACSNNPHDYDADDSSVLFSAYTEDPRSLDPAEAGDSVQYSFIMNMQGRAFQFNYLNRPVEIEPDLAESLGVWGVHPGTGADGKPRPDLKGKATFTIKIRKGLQWQSDICFDADKKEAKTREITARDFEFALKRQATPTDKIAGTFMLAGKLVGLKEYSEILRKSQGGDKGKKFDYSQPMAGVEVLDDYTIRMTLYKKNAVFQYFFANPFSSPTPIECFEYYDGSSENRPQYRRNPISSGPYYLKEWKEAAHITLAANPNYRKETYPATSNVPQDKKDGYLNDAGKRLPLTKTIHYRIYKQAIMPFLSFEQGYLDLSAIPRDVYNQVMEGTSLSEDYKARGIQLKKSKEPTIYYIMFKMTDPVVGGYSAKKKNLRKALSIAFDRASFIKILTNGRGIPANGPVPPGVSGHDPDYKNPNTEFNLARAKDLLKQAGYPDGIDPKTKRPLEIKMLTAAGVGPSPQIRLIQKSFEAIGVNLVPDAYDFDTKQAKARKGDFQISLSGWHSDYPEAENFFQLLYSPNMFNVGKYSSPAFDDVYRKLNVTTDPVQKQKLVQDGINILNDDSPWLYIMYTVKFGLFHKWLHNYKPNPQTYGFTKYLRIEGPKRGAYVTANNKPAYWVVIIFVLLLVGLVTWAVPERRKLD